MVWHCSLDAKMELLVPLPPVPKQFREEYNYTEGIPQYFYLLLISRRERLAIGGENIKEAGKTYLHLHVDRQI